MAKLTPEQLARAAEALTRNPRSTMSDLAQQLGLSRATLNRAVSNRLALVEQIATAVLDDQEAAHRELGVLGWFRDGDETPLQDHVVPLLERLVPMGPQISFLLSSPETTHVAFLESRSAALDSEVDDAFDRAAAAGLMPSVAPREWPRAALYALAFTASELVASGALAPRDAATLTWRAWAAGFAGAIR